ncbi:hypothetical protein GCM10022396_36530 [Flavivirga amylovorans]
MLVDFFQPMPLQAPLVSDGIWGAPNVIPRDTANGLEDPKLKNWNYWDGRIVKSDDGKYHFYGSRWTQSVNHSKGWHDESKGIHAVSDNVMGPYKDLGEIWPQWNNGKGSNVIGLRMHDGRYAVITSEITKGEVFVSDNPNGPFKLLGEIKIDLNGFPYELARYDENNKGAVKNGMVGNMSNVKILLRPDGNYMIIPRSTAPMLSTNGILGPYKIMGDRVFVKQFPEYNVWHMEDPSVWYNNGIYHIIVNHWPTKTTHHFTSFDGINDWEYQGVAFKKEANIFKYTNEIVNDWVFVERATPYVENGHVTHIIFSVLDVKKGQDKANDKHGSKIVVVPFDGKAFDDYMHRKLKLKKEAFNNKD